ncbi:MAG TPA: zinc-dependent metalloprotease family protein, partial [Iamia sp.]|nr:zinc-dependent metalloprotease family protein [Iamia sp.]
MGTSATRAVVVIGLAVAAFVGAGPRAEAQTGPDEPLLVTGEDTATPGRGTILRQRAVAVDVGTLARTGHSDARLALFDDVQVDVALAPAVSGAAGWRAWSGTVDGEPDSSVVVATDGVFTSALLTLPGATYRVRTRADGSQVAQEVRPLAGEGDDTVELPGPTAPSAVGPAGPSADLPPAGAAGDLPSYHVIDVLVAFTPQAQAQAGSRATLDAEAAFAVTLSNTAFHDSGVNGRFRLAGTYPVSENLNCTHLTQFRSDGDGVADGVHDRRDELGADIVTVLSGAACGLGYRPVHSTHVVDSTVPFSVVGYAWAVDNLTFPHELGHNLGMNHDRYAADPTDPDLYPYGYGYVNVASGWRTIMAYNDQCSAAATSCTRIARYSNPDATYEGEPTGRPSTGPTPADGRKVLNQTFPIIAEHRSTPAPFTSWTRFVQQQARDLQYGATVPAGTASTLSAQLT